MRSVLKARSSLWVSRTGGKSALSLIHSCETASKLASLIEETLSGCGAIGGRMPLDRPELAFSQ
jgi:hypothetical protein